MNEPRTPMKVATLVGMIPNVAQAYLDALEAEGYVLVLKSELEARESPRPALGGKGGPGAAPGED